MKLDQISLTNRETRLCECNGMANPKTRLPPHAFPCTHASTGVGISIGEPPNWGRLWPHLLGCGAYGWSCRNTPLVHVLSCRICSFYVRYDPVVNVILWSGGGDSPDEAMLEQAPYPFHTHLIWRYLGIKWHFTDSIRGLILLQGAQIGAGDWAPPPGPTSL